MTRTSHRVVMHTNVLLRAFIDHFSPAGRVLAAAQERKFVTLLSDAVLVEYRQVLAERDLVERFPALEPHRVDQVIARLRCSPLI